MTELKLCIRPLLALSIMFIAPLPFLFLCPDLLSICILTFLDLFSGFKAWLTPPVLFILMNAVVFALAFTSGFIKQRPTAKMQGKNRERQQVQSRRGDADFGDADEEEEEEEEEDEALYPEVSEVFSSFFGDGSMVTRRKPPLKRSISSSSVERKSRPAISSSLFQKHLLANGNSTPSVGLADSEKPLLKVLLPHAHTAVPPTKKTVTFDVKKPTAFQVRNGNAEDKDVDQRADAFIGNFYKNMKLQQVDPYIESLERSYGS